MREIEDSLLSLYKAQLMCRIFGVLCTLLHIVQWAWHSLFSHLPPINSTYRINMAANAVQISSQRDNLSCTSASVPWGHTYMTSALGGGSPKTRGKEHNQLISVRDNGRRGGPKIRQFCGRHISIAPFLPSYLSSAYLLCRLPDDWSPRSLAVPLSSKGHLSRSVTCTRMIPPLFFGTIVLQSLSVCPLYESEGPLQMHLAD